MQVREGRPDGGDDHAGRPAEQDDRRDGEDEAERDAARAPSPPREPGSARRAPCATNSPTSAATCRCECGCVGVAKTRAQRARRPPPTITGATTARTLARNPASRHRSPTAGAGAGAGLCSFTRHRSSPTRCAGLPAEVERIQPSSRACSHCSTRRRQENHEPRLPLQHCLPPGDIVKDARQDGLCGPAATVRNHPKGVTASRLTEAEWRSTARGRLRAAAGGPTRTLLVPAGELRERDALVRTSG